MLFIWTLFKILIFSLQGFEHHVRNEHNMWAYVFFIIHLDSVKTSDYTALELYVAKSVCKLLYVSRGKIWLWFLIFGV
jgi:formate/nitrite transporter FocA (FNT family)